MDPRSSHFIITAVLIVGVSVVALSYQMYLITEVEAESTVDRMSCTMNKVVFIDSNSQAYNKPSEYKYALEKWNSPECEEFR